MGVTLPGTTRQPPVAIAPDKATTFEADTALRSLTTRLDRKTRLIGPANVQADNA